MDQILKQDAHVTLAQIRGGDLSAEHLMAVTLDHIDRINGTYNAIVSRVPRDTLIAAARAADTAEARGPLHGLPIAVKDLADVAGLPTTRGSPLFVGHIAERSDIMVRRMQDAGAIVIGKTNTPEFGLGSNTYNPVFGITRNALVSGLTAGGSSGGAAVALATHMTALADGSDAMGSLRNPAGWNGVYGMRPSWGRVPAENDGDLFLHPMSTEGPMARCPADLALLLDVQSGADPRQVLGYAAAPVAGQLDADLVGRRIGWLGDWGGAYPMESQLLDHCAAQVRRLTALGCVVEDVPPPFDAKLMWESYTNLRAWDKLSLAPMLDAHPGALKPEAVWEIAKGRKLTNAQIVRASAIRSDWLRTAVALFDRFDALVLPTAQCWPFPSHIDWPHSLGGRVMDSYHRWMEVMVPVSLIGLPSLAVPCDAGPTGLPIGLQIFGRPRDDLGVLQLGQGWHGLPS